MKNLSTHLAPAGRRPVWRRAMCTAVAVAAMAPAAAGMTAGAAHADIIASPCDSAPIGLPMPPKAPAWDGTAATVNAYLAAVNLYNNNYGVAYARNTTAYSQIGATGYYAAGYYGQGVDVALIDSGVNTALPGLDKGNVVQGPDLSVESQAAYGPNANGALVHNDSFGHGTHLASIISGRDSSVTDPKAFKTNVDGQFAGVAPLARTISIKVADGRGATDVTQVIAAVDWVVKHAHDKGMNIRVLNLSYGLTAYDDSTVDALSYSIEQAWQAGIVVVAAAGNSGRPRDGNDTGLASPAYNRDVIAVGAVDSNYVPAYYSSSSTSTNMRMPDFAVPGSLTGLHNPGSTQDAEIIDQCAVKGMATPVFGPPTASGEGRFLKGSGTSQAAALVSGAIALVLSRNPELYPDIIKQTLRQTASSISTGLRRVTGEGLVDLTAAYAKWTAGYKRFTQNNNAVTGGRNIDSARGWILDDNMNAVPNWLVGPTGEVLSGEKDWLGNPLTVGGIQRLEKVDPNHSPYCLSQLDWVAQTGMNVAGSKCTAATPNTSYAPTIWANASRLSYDALGKAYVEMGETWNGRFVIGQGMKPAPAAFGNPLSSLIPTAPGAAWVMGTWFGPNPQSTNWVADRWTKGAWKDDAWSKAAWKADGWLGARWKDSDWVKVAWKDGDWS